MLVRAEEQRDWAAVHAVNVAFETSVEANLVDALREQAQPFVSLIAEDNGAMGGGTSCFRPCRSPAIPRLGSWASHLCTGRKLLSTAP